MNEHSQIPMAIIVGAATGAVAGYLLLTDHGRRFRSRIDRALDDVVREMRKLSRTIDKACSAADGWRVLNEAAGEDSDDASRGIRRRDRDQPAAGNRD
jgi:hypothetical protein